MIRYNMLRYNIWNEFNWRKVRKEKIFILLTVHCTHCCLNGPCSCVLLIVSVSVSAGENCFISLALHHLTYFCWCLPLGSFSQMFQQKWFQLLFYFYRSSYKWQENVTFLTSIAVAASPLIGGYLHFFCCSVLSSFVFNKETDKFVSIDQLS